MAEKYRVLVGLNYPGKKGEKGEKGEKREKRAEPGAVVKDLPEESIPWLLEDGHIEPVEEE